MTPGRDTRAASTLAREARSFYREAVGTQAGLKTNSAVFRANLRELEARAQAWDAMDEALSNNAYGALSAGDVCAVGFERQERLSRG